MDDCIIIILLENNRIKHKNGVKGTENVFDIMFFDEILAMKNDHEGFLHFMLKNKSLPLNKVTQYMYRPYLFLAFCTTYLFTTGIQICFQSIKNIVIVGVKITANL